MLPAMSVARGVGVSIVLLVALGGLAWLFFTSEPVAPDPAARGPAAPTEPAQGLPGREDPLTRRLGAGSVRGRVLSADDAPIAGATVCALATSELADDLRRFPTCTSSADDGSYQLAGLLAVPQRIVASAANFLPATWSVGEGPARTDLLALAAGQERRDIDLTLRPGGAPLRGSVRELGGGVIEGAHVSSGPAHARSDADGRFLLWVPPGPETTVRARADGYTDGEALGVAPGRTFELVLLPEAVLRGRAVNAESGAAIADARVVISAADGFFMTQRGDTTTDEHGRFRVGGLPPGPYKAEVIADEAYGLADAQVNLGVGQGADPLEIRAHPAHLLVGVAAVEGRGACTKGHVVLEPEGPGAPRGATIDAEGAARLRGVLPGPYRLSIACPGAVPLINEPLLVDQTQTDLRWRLAAGLSVRGRVVDARGRPAPGLWVSDYDSDAGASAASAQTDEDGRFELAGLRPGEHLLRLTGPGPLPDRPTELLLPPGDDLSGVTIQLPPAGQLRGRLLDLEGRGLAGLVVTLHSPDHPALTAHSADDGGYRFDRAPLGRHTLSARRRGQPLALAAGPADAADAADAAEGVPGRSVTIAANAVTTADLTVDDPTVQLSGVVLDPGGAPVQGALVTATLEHSADPKAIRAAARQPSGVAELALSDAAGAYLFSRDLPAARYTLRATRGDGAEALLTGVTAQTRDKTLRLRSACAIAGVVRLRGAPPRALRRRAQRRRCRLLPP
jgi:protocatechuate 3,4-dioxygenase beta subunit